MVRLVPLKWLLPAVAVAGVLLFAAGFYAGSVSRPATAASAAAQALRETDGLLGRVEVDYSRVGEGSLNVTAVSGILGQARDAYAKAGPAVAQADPARNRRIEEGLANLEALLKQREEPLRKITDLVDDLRADIRAAATLLGAP